ncbi:energy-coupled thiamine transporter ThiT [Clostridium algidicarnis]|uniref:energy-coupled thiamine transporter ThiT n=1 Tax=Clostridium algidicarnis TaxID=37659 RepID=UPI001C0E412F|nr:energy-coupled thiamine transporter ThiT [Clostridium algidicarnis]MBU3210584.1 energy-coupled thiamine transporter ThiT [Clostridium algidicarnis]MBU3228242.1 energy-coupled thiamine transporter ThiT [Clostridium algidicarnis]MBU3252126.1 energy-coupled thiamine transporter ThiT [Clostridium algidicarnis]
MDWFNFKFKAPKAGDSLKEVFSNPMIYLTLLVVLAIAIVFVYISKVKLTTRTIIHVGIAIALAIVLKMFRIMQMPMGGSVTLGSMIPIIFIAYVYGPRVGYLTGMLFGVMDLLLGAYVVHPMQLLLDYVLAFGVLGVAGYFKNNISIGALVAISLRFLCHIASGVIFFSSYAGEQNALVYSILYNGTYLLPEAIIAMIILAVLPTKRLRTEISKGAY